MENNSKSTKTVADVLKLKKRLKVYAIILIVVGIVGGVCSFSGLVWYIVMKSIHHFSIRFSVMMYYIISIIVASAIISAGVYMLKTARLISVGLKNKIENFEEEIDDKKE